MEDLYKKYEKKNNCGPAQYKQNSSIRSVLDVSSRIDYYKCQICFENFNSSTRRPVNGKCGHTMCIECWNIISGHFSGSLITCSFCQTKMNSTEFIINYLAEQLAFDLVDKSIQNRQLTHLLNISIKEKKTNYEISILNEKKLNAIIVDQTKKIEHLEIKLLNSLKQRDFYFSQFKNQKLINNKINSHFNYINKTIENFVNNVKSIISNKNF